MIGLLYRGQALLGVIDHPVLGLCYAGAAGLGVFRNESRLAEFSADLGELGSHEIIVTSSPGSFERSAEWAEFLRLVAHCKNIRIYFDCYSMTQTLEEAVAGGVEFNYKIWDFAPLDAMISELKGRLVYIRRVPQENGPTLLSTVYGRPGVVKKLLELFPVKVGVAVA